MKLLLPLLLLSCTMQTGGMKQSDLSNEAMRNYAFVQCMYEDEFFAQESEIETAAAECLAMDFLAIATAYGFEADVEMLIATREW